MEHVICFNNNESINKYIKIGNFWDIRIYDKKYPPYDNIKIGEKCYIKYKGSEEPLQFRGEALDIKYIKTKSKEFEKFIKEFQQSCNYMIYSKVNEDNPKYCICIHIGNFVKTRKANIEYYGKLNSNWICCNDITELLTDDTTGEAEVICEDELDKQYLFWVETNCHTEDYFVVSTSCYFASRFHESYQGFNTGYARTKKICTISNVFKRSRSYYPNIEHLRKMSINIIQEKPSIVWTKNKKIYYSGNLLREVIINKNHKKKGVYIVRSGENGPFKIGKTKDIKTRLKKINTDTPYPLELELFIPCNNYSEVERYLHKVFNKNNIGGEWFNFSEMELFYLHKASGSINIELRSILG